MYTIEHLGGHFIEISGVGVSKKGIKLICNEKVAREFSKDPKFKVTGLSTKKNNKNKEDD